MVSRVGLVLPRSIWLTYSFEKRSPARSVWVRPAATRSCRRRSPSRLPDWVPRRVFVAARGISDSREVNCMLHQYASGAILASPKKGMSGRKSGSSGKPENHLIELLDDIRGQVYSQSTLQHRRSQVGAAEGAPRNGDGQPGSVAGPQSHSFRVVASRSRSIE